VYRIELGAAGSHLLHDSTNRILHEFAPNG